MEELNNTQRLEYLAGRFDRLLRPASYPVAVKRTLTGKYRAP